ncbi:MAG: gamma-glutamyltransferase [Limisphaerales bacterium]
MRSLLILVGSWLVGSAVAQTRSVESRWATRSEVMARGGMACTSQPLATQVALDILQAGGTAVDAAIAANAAIGLMEPTGNGVGGDLFAIVWDGERLHGLNGSGRSPRALAMEHFQELGLEHIPSFGPLPVSVPGCVDGWCELHRRFGRLSLKRVLGPAIRYAEEGFPVSPVIAEGWASNAERLKGYPGFAETFMPGGKAPGVGEVFRNPGLAQTLKRIARKGRKGFYEGEVAERIAAYMKEQGGFLSEEDLALHRSEWVEPVSVQYRGYDVWELPPNGQGIAALQMLNILEAFDLRAMGFGSADYMHVFTEAKKLAFEDRARYYADPDFFRTPVERLLSKEYAAERRGLIDLGRAAEAYTGGLTQLETSDTIYLTVADSEGMMVSLIQSNYRGLGSGMTPPGLGFVLQNRGELFDLKPGRPNSYAPGKRPFHTIIPAFVTKGGKPWMSFGVMGGDMQPQGHVQVLVNLIDFGMSLQEAGDAPRMHHVRSSEPTGERMVDGGQLNVEAGFEPEVLEELRGRGHRIGSEPTAYYGGYQAIMRDVEQGVYWGASESRKDGQAGGY